MSAHGHRTRSKLSLPNALRRLGLVSGCKLMLDPADAASFSGGQTWSDISGQGNDFYRGASNIGGADDPTQVGTNGDLAGTTYWSFDGGDFLTLASGSNPNWINSIHKSGGKCSIAAWVYVGTGSTNQAIIGTNGDVSTNIGFSLRAGSTNKLNFNTRNGSAASINLSSSGSITAGAWTFCGLSFDEGAGASGTAMVVNGVASLHNGAATSPSAAAATYPAQIGSSGAGASGMLTNNSRLGLLLAWDNVALGANALLALFEETRGRFSV